MVGPGDANYDGRVDLTDFGLLKAGFGVGTKWGQGNFDGLGVTDLSDFGILKENFGKIFGLMTSLMGIGTGVGPWIAGAIFDRTGSYQAWLIAAAVISGIAGLLVFRLGAYPIWENETGEAPKPG